MKWLKFIAFLMLFMLLNTNCFAVPEIYSNELSNETKLEKGDSFSVISGIADVERSIENVTYILYYSENGEDYSLVNSYGNGSLTDVYRVIFEEDFEDNDLGNFQCIMEGSGTGVECSVNSTQAVGSYALHVWDSNLADSNIFAVANFSDTEPYISVPLGEKANVTFSTYFPSTRPSWMVYSILGTAHVPYVEDFNDLSAGEYLTFNPVAAETPPDMVPDRYLGNGVTDFTVNNMNFNYSEDVWQTTVYEIDEDLTDFGIWVDGDLKNSSVPYSVYNNNKKKEIYGFTSIGSTWDLDVGNYFYAGEHYIDDIEVATTGYNHTSQPAAEFSADEAGYYKLETVIFNTEGANSTQTIEFEVENDAPVVNSVNIFPILVSPSCGINTEITINASVSDLQNYTDIAVVKAKIFNTTQSVSSPNYEITLEQKECSGNCCNYTGLQNLTYWDEASASWNATVIANDSFSEEGVNSSLFEYEEQVCLSITDVPIVFENGYPSEVKNASIGSGFPMASQNLGNIGIDLSIYGTDLVGVSDELFNISAGNVEYGLLENFAYLSYSPVIFTADLCPIGSNSTYFKITLPAVIKPQTYTGNLTISAVKS